VTVFDRLWSTLPYLRPMATITSDSLAGYGVDVIAGASMTRHALRSRQSHADRRRFRLRTIPTWCVPWRRTV
jgi:hypothetical protein